LFLENQGFRPVSGYDLSSFGAGGNAMIRRVLLGSGAILIGAAVVCAGVVFWGVVRLTFEMPEFEEGKRQVVQLRPWGLAFWGCLLTGCVALWFVPDRGKQATAEPDAGATRNGADLTS
jgi:hypothetical protein